MCSVLGGGGSRGVSEPRAIGHGTRITALLGRLPSRLADFWRCSAVRAHIQLLPPDSPWTVLIFVDSAPHTHTLLLPDSSLTVLKSPDALTRSDHELDLRNRGPRQEVNEKHGEERKTRRAFRRRARVHTSEGCRGSRPSLTAPGSAAIPRSCSWSTVRFPSPSRRRGEEKYLEAGQICDAWARTQVSALVSSPRTRPKGLRAQAARPSCTRDASSQINIYTVGRDRRSPLENSRNDRPQRYNKISIPLHSISTKALRCAPDCHAFVVGLPQPPSLALGFTL